METGRENIRTSLRERKRKERHGYFGFGDRLASVACLSFVRGSRVETAPTFLRKCRFELPFVEEVTKQCKSGVQAHEFTKSGGVLRK